MGLLSQLRLLLWKNILQQWRSPWFAFFELVVPLFLIGLSFGLLIGFSGQFETEYSNREYPSWPVSGSAFDLLYPTNPNKSTSAIVEPYFLSGVNLDCQFLEIQNTSTGYQLNIALAYTPMNPDTTDKIMKIVQERYTIPDILKLIEPILNLNETYGLNITLPSFDTNMTIRGFATETEMVNYMTSQLQSSCGNPLLAGIVFDTESVVDNLYTSDDYKYTIRLSNTHRRAKNVFGNDNYPWDTTVEFSIQYISGPINPDDVDGGSPGYWQEGFMTLQRSIDIAIKQLITNEESLGKLYYIDSIMVGRFPFPAYSTKIIQVGAFFMPVITIFSFMTSVIYIVRSVVVEKEDRLKEYMRVMGLSQFINWIAHFIINYAKITFSIIVLTILLHFVALKSDMTVMFVFFMAYAFDIVYFAFTISTFMNSATSATMIAVVFWMLLYFWFAFFSTYDDATPYSLSIRLLNCLNPDIALNYGIQLLSAYETQAGGLKWNLIFTAPSPDNNITFAHALFALIVDGIIMVIVTWYIEAVIPGGEGVPQKPWFFILPSYWFPYSSSKIEKYDNDEHVSFASHVKLENEPNEKPTISVVNLTKTYGTSFFKKLFDCKFGKLGEKKAVQNLNLNIYPGQCTVLLGHNGAGKSTTFSMLTGVAAPSNGTAIVNDLDIRTNLPKIRKQMGLCPQYNTLFGFMTVMEHLEFFAKLKERKWDKEEAMEILTRLRIEFKADALSSTLSGGQKRKLSLAIALIGGSEIVMLDEPTSGMDPGARHETWTLIQREKERRTILLTTHFMEEADLLGDRIAIMAHGQLECCGSPMFLKKQYGDGYHLTIVYKSSDHADVSQTTDIIREYIPGTTLYSFIGQEATYLLSSEHRATFPKLFKELEAYQNNLGVTSFGVSVTTMEEVFLKVGNVAEERHNREEGIQEENHEMIDKDDPALQNLRAPRRNTGFVLQMQHMKAMFIKRAIFFFRKWTQFIPQLLFPIAYLILLVSVSKIVPKVKEQDPITISLQPYADQSEESYIIVKNGNYDDTPLYSLVNQTVKSLGYSSDKIVTKVTDDVQNLIFNLTNTEGSRDVGLHYGLAFIPLSYKGLQTIQGLFNNFAYFAAPLSITMTDSMLLSEKTNKNYTFTAINHPLPPTTSDTLKTTDAGAFAAGLLAYGLIVSFSVMVAGYAQFLITESKKKSKHMQLLSGIRPWMYWLTAFIWDAVWFILRVLCFDAVFYIFNIVEYTNDFGVLLSLTLAMMLYGWTTIPLTYFFQFFFSSAPKGFMIVVMYHILTGMIGSIAVPIITQTSSEDAGYHWSIIFAFVFPTYNIAQIATLVYNNENIRQACQKLDCSNVIFQQVTQCCGTADEKLYVDNVLFAANRKGILILVVFLGVQGFIYWFMVFMKEMDWFSKIVDFIKCKRNSTSLWDIVEEETSVEDSDVIAEKQNVKKLLQHAQDYSLISNNLTKWYGNFNAVKGVNFHLKSKECFGLLGVNGAGKTSTFQMLTGENTITSGDAFVNGWSVKNNWREAGQRVGYCPQYDAVIKEMSAEETLYMFARIRGIPESEIPGKVDAVIHAIGIGIYAKRQIKSYSGGNKRRLSLGIAIIGLPDVLLLDEPTSGVDPKARRIIWNILNRVRDLGTSLVLTSHSMDECEALCTELAIMVYGKFRCYGSCQHIKSRYGEGYTLLIRLKNSQDAQQTKTAIRRHFEKAYLKEEHILQLNYDIPREGVNWSTLFERLENVSRNLNWEDYSLSQTTLEQVFIEFSRNAATDGYTNKALDTSE